MKVLLFLAFFLFSISGNANPETEERIRRLSEKLRCLVCQNQTLADSNAELASDLRRQLREQVAAGHSDDEILDFLVQRYGDFVLYDPPFKATTLLLWLGPFVLLAAAALVLVTTLRRRRRAPEEPALGQDDKRLVERVLGPATPSGKPDGGAR
ncbi:MAG: cytochrome c-type biogenesis protein CcmH [Betaproteobacteria bacterium]|nr:cytochrome c-type biogenesis protein CcmH [Betaproteobacteria bacterium]